MDMDGHGAANFIVVCTTSTASYVLMQGLGRRNGDGATQ